MAGDLSFVSLNAGPDQTCGVTSNGQAYCWGIGSEGQLGNGTTLDASTPEPVSGDLEFESLACGGTHTCGVATNGDVYCWGFNDRGQLGNGTTVNSTIPVRVLH